MTVAVVIAFDVAGQGPVAVDAKVVKINSVVEAIGLGSVAAKTAQLGSLVRASAAIVAALVAAV